jgi:predicted DNA-binding transcriptional regulator AlpA
MPLPRSCIDLPALFIVFAGCQIRQRGAHFPPLHHAQVIRPSCNRNGCGGIEVHAIPENVMRRLEALAKNGEAITTDQVREDMGLTRQQLHQYTLEDDFPPREQIGRKFWVNPVALYAFAATWNALAAAITITDVAILLRMTIATARRTVRAADFPRPLGHYNGRDRWDRAAIIEWHRPRVGGAKLPPDADVDTQSTSKRTRTAKGTRDGKAQKGKAGARA